MDTDYTFSESPILWIVSHFLSAFPNIFTALTQPSLWLDWVSWEKNYRRQAVIDAVYILWRIN